MTHLPLLGRAAIVTGGAKGIGGVISSKLASLGCQITLVSRDKTALAAKTESLNTSFPLSSPHAFIAIDLAHPHTIEGQLRSLDLSPVSILVNCAGQSQKRLVLQTSLQDIHSITNVNLISPITLCKLLARPMARSGEPADIVNISSIVADPKDHNLIGASVYCATKAALSKFSKVFSAELQAGRRTSNVRIHCLEPALVANTQMGSDVAHDSMVETTTADSVADAVAHAILSPTCD